MDRVERYWIYHNCMLYDITFDRFTINHAGGYRRLELSLSFDKFIILAIL